jgi:hypothetical protein
MATLFRIWDIRERYYTDYSGDYELEFVTTEAVFSHFAIIGKKHEDDFLESVAEPDIKVKSCMQLNNIDEVESLKQACESFIKAYYEDERITNECYPELARENRIRGDD